MLITSSGLSPYKGRREFSERRHYTHTLKDHLETRQMMNTSKFLWMTCVCPLRYVQEND